MSGNIRKKKVPEDSPETPESTPKTQPENQPVFETQPQNSNGSWWQTFISGNLLLRKKFIANIPFILYVSALLVLLIYNRYKMEHLVMETNRVNKEIKSLQQRHSEVRMKYQNATRLFEIQSKLESTGIAISQEPIRRMIILSPKTDTRP